MTLYFITGNKNKFNEVKEILNNIDIEMLDIDLPEIQEMDSKKIVQEKLKQALKHKKGEFIVEDTSLFIDSLNGLPGPLSKWFEKKLGNHGIYKLVENSENKKATAQTIIGYAKNENEIHFFKGTVKGEIVSPQSESSFGWDPIFKPQGYSKTFAEIEKKEKNSISMRSIAVKKLKEFLETN